ncbi:MAG TPA: sensor histidine kinase, partial [Lachnospiraceae bacterium]|nr:sensor histidine kinase [Lachnospiraceae bacterium]
AIKYGTDCIPPWFITIKGTCENDRWTITVTDSGDGFSEDTLIMLHKKIEETTLNSGMPELTINGLGLLNVYMRWKIYMKDKAVFSFGNTENGHAYVSIGASGKKEDSL